MQSTYKSHIVRIATTLITVSVLGYLAILILTPEGFGEYGHFRTDAVQDELNRKLRHQTNDSCLKCHPYIREMHLDGVHKSVSCEFCHGPYADHIQEDTIIAKLPVTKGENIKTLCLRCHNKIIRARPKEYIKMVEMPQHLEKLGVRTDHICDQCHNVHSPLLYVDTARRLIKNGEQSL